MSHSLGRGRDQGKWTRVPLLQNLHPLPDIAGSHAAAVGHIFLALSLTYLTCGHRRGGWFRLRISSSQLVVKTRCIRGHTSPMALWPTRSSESLSKVLPRTDTGRLDETRLLFPHLFLLALPFSSFPFSLLELASVVLAPYFLPESSGVPGIGPPLGIDGTGQYLMRTGNPRST